MLNLNKTLKIGDQGEDILELQRLLIGWDPGKLDGASGPKTIAAVYLFQKEHNLQAHGEADPETIREIYREPERHRISFADYLCKCGNCDGFGKARYDDEYREGKPRIEAYHKHEYPGLDRTIFWALIGLMHRAELKSITITSGYRCWDYNEQTGRQTTNHMGKAIDFIGHSNGRQHNGSISDKNECDECARIRKVGIEECGFQPGWSIPGRVSFEMPKHGTYTWVHIDTRMIDRSVRQHVMAMKELIEGPKNFI